MSDRPKELVFELTARCNYHCPFCCCVWHEDPSLAEPERDTAFWRKQIRRCAQEGTKRILFSGGEVLMRDDCKELFRFAREELPEASLELFTNGSRLTEGILNFCKKYEIRLAITLLGVRLQTHREMTGTYRTCRRTLEWISRGAEIGWNFSVGMTATRENASEFGDMFAAAVLAGARFIQMGAMRPEGRGRECPGLALTPAEWERVKEEIRSLPDARVPYEFCDEMVCTCRPQPERLLKKFGAARQEPCAAGREFGVIGPNGRYRKCLHALTA